MTDHGDHDHDHHHHDGPHDYVAAIQGYRAEQDEFFKTSAGSPIPPGQRDAFTDLPYYPVNVYQPTIFHWLNYAAMARDTGATVVVPLYPLAPQGTAATDVPAMADLISSQIDQHEARMSVCTATPPAVWRWPQCWSWCVAVTPVPSHMVLASPPLDATFSDPASYTIDDPALNVYEARDVWGAAPGRRPRPGRSAGQPAVRVA